MKSDLEIYVGIHVKMWVIKAKRINSFVLAF